MSATSPPAPMPETSSRAQPGGDQIRRRYGRAVPHPRAGRTGQGTAGRMAGSPGVLAFNEDKTRIVHLDRRGSISWGSASAATQRQAADQTEHGGHQTDPGTARSRDARTARVPTRRRSSPRSTPSSGAGRPTTGVWCRPGRSTPWTTTCGSSPTSGPHAATPTSRRRGSSPATSASSTSPGTTGGCSATAPAAPTWSSSPGPTSSGTPPVTGGASPDDPALAEYWAERRRRIKPPLDGYTLRLLTRQNGRCPLCGDDLLCAEQPPQSPTSGNAGGCRSPGRR